MHEDVCDKVGTVETNCRKVGLYRPQREGHFEAIFVQNALCIEIGNFDRSDGHAGRFSWVSTRVISCCAMKSPLHVAHLITPVTRNQVPIVTFANSSYAIVAFVVAANGITGNISQVSQIADTTHIIIVSDKVKSYIAVHTNQFIIKHLSQDAPWIFKTVSCNCKVGIIALA